MSFTGWSVFAMSDSDFRICSHSYHKLSCCTWSYVHWIEFAQKNFDRSTCITHLMSSPTLFTPPTLSESLICLKLYKQAPNVHILHPHPRIICIGLCVSFRLLFFADCSKLSQCCQSSSFFIKGVTGHDVNNQSSSNIHTAPMCSTHAAADAAAAANSDGS